MAASLLVDLPYEVWLNIFSSLSLSSLHAFSLSSRRFRNLSRNYVLQRRDLRQQYGRLFVEDPIDCPDAGCEKAINDPAPWLPLVLKYLRTPDIAENVEVITCSLAGANRHLLADSDTCPVLPIPELSDTDKTFLTAKAKWVAETWLPPALREPFTAHVLALDEDALQTLLIAHLPNISHLKLPSDGGGDLSMPYLHGMATYIHELIKCQPNKDHPFAQVNIIEAQPYINGSVGLSFDSILPFITLPSVRILASEQNHGAEDDDGSYTWPGMAALPMSKVEGIGIEAGTVTKAAMTSFVKHCVKGPCIITQVWGYRRYESEEPDCDWEWLDYPGDQKGEEEWEWGLPGDEEESEDELEEEGEYEEEDVVEDEAAEENNVLRWV